MLQEPILEVRGLKTSFGHEAGKIMALDGVDLKVYPGKTLGIVGESGCGKSVTARSILRILEPNAHIDGGEILFHGEKSDPPLDLAALPANGSRMRAVRGGRIALIFQEPMTSLSSYYTVGNQIEEVIRNHRGLRGKAAREMAIDYLRQVGIPHPAQRADQYPFQLSGGLRQRVVIAMALAGDPEILIADEPTTALDVTTQAQILELMNRIQAENGLSLILITHDMGVVAEMCDDVAVMYLGRVVEHAPASQLFADPRHPYTRQLLRSIPDVMSEPKTKLPTIPGSVPPPYARPPGCTFHPRCPRAEPGICDQVLPPDYAVSPAHVAACHFAGEIN